MIIVNCCYVHNLHHLFLAKKKKKKKLTPFAIIFPALCTCATVIGESLISHESTIHSHTNLFFFFREFQPMASVFYDCSLLSDQDTNQFLV